MKKLIILLLVLCLGLTLVACGDDVPDPPDNGGENTPGDGGDNTPGDGGDNTPGDGGDNTPGDGGDNTPGDGGENTPGDGGEDDEPPYEGDGQEDTNDNLTPPHVFG